MRIEAPPFAFSVQFSNHWIFGNEIIGHRPFSIALSRTLPSAQAGRLERVFGQNVPNSRTTAQEQFPANLPDSDHCFIHQ
jgi:hypothetical protein